MNSMVVPGSFIVLASAGMAIGGVLLAKKKKKKQKKAASSKVNPQVQLETTKGGFTVELFADVPVSSKNFMDLVSAGFYDGLIFHRYVPGFVIQGGDPTGTGMGGSDKTIPLEITDHKHEKGALGMARSQDPDSASSQFYVCLEDTHQLNGGYCVFGRVVEGMDNVLKLRQGDKMLKVTPVAAPSLP